MSKAAGKLERQEIDSAIKKMAVGFNWGQQCDKRRNRLASIKQRRRSNWVGKSYKKGKK